MILRRFAGIALGLAALLTGPVQASDGVGVEILQYGLFRAEIVSKQSDAGGVAMHNIVDNICHLATTRTVPMQVGVHFGVRYRVTGPVAGQRVMLKKIIRYPGIMTPPSPGQPSSLVSNFVELRVGTTTYTEYALEYPWELAPGTWIFQFFERDRKLAEFSFMVSEDASVAEATDPACFRLSS